MKQNINIFIFRRDLRLQDNITLEKLWKTDSTISILPIFIFNPKQIDKNKNAYHSKNIVQFMIECLKNLKSHCPNLLFFHGDDCDVLDRILSHFIINTVAWNMDITPFARKRDEKIIEWCQAKSIHFITGEDYTLFPMNTIVTLGNKPYEMFTPFCKRCLNKLEGKIFDYNENKNIQFYKGNIKGLEIVRNIDIYNKDEYNIHIHSYGGRNHAFEILDKIKSKYFQDYETMRDYPSISKTTGLSPYLKFGCVSIREVFNIVVQTHGLKHGLIRELLWRDFYCISISKSIRRSN